MTDDGFADRVSRLAALAEPVRRDLFRYVVDQAEPVSRDQASEGVGIARHTAKFHLDKLVEEGLLTTEFRRLTGRSGPGAGRPAKLYRRSERQVDLTLPRRQYELAGHVLASAVELAAQDDVPALEAVRRTARRTGQGLDLPTSAHDARPSDDELDTMVSAVEAFGYEPRREGDVVQLGNCPFDRLVDQHRSLVCTMNLALLGGVIERCECPDVAARLDPAPGRCCVTLTLAGDAGRAAQPPR